MSAGNIFAIFDIFISPKTAMKVKQALNEKRKEKKGNPITVQNTKGIVVEIFKTYFCSCLVMMCVGYFP